MWSGELAVRWFLGLTGRDTRRMGTLGLGPSIVVVRLAEWSNAGIF